MAPAYDRQWSRYIDATVNATLRRLPALASGQQVLDVGCGTGALLEALAQRHPRVSLSGADPVGSMLDVARQRLPESVGLYQAPADSLPFGTGQFDVLVSTSAFHYFEHPRAAVAEMHRVLKPNGRLVITDWCRDYLSMRLLGAWLRLTRRPFQHIYCGQELQHLLSQSAFADVRVRRYRIDRLWGMMTVTGTARSQ